jgi:hypothetical protein
LSGFEEGERWLWWKEEEKMRDIAVFGVGDFAVQSGGVEIDSVISLQLRGSYPRYAQRTWES